MICGGTKPITPKDETARSITLAAQGFTDPQPGQKRKTRWQFTLEGQTWFWMAGIVRDGAFGEIFSTEAEYHHPGLDALFVDEALKFIKEQQGKPFYVQSRFFNWIDIGRVT